ncbi:MAG TPA: hypothetical protein VM121_04930 [Acidimicrobiales bacterium]|nr:hypothetical protein [Acidimicrobiales bacterium]
MEKRSFWSSAPGIITGAAGLLSATAAVVGLLVTFGVIGGSSDSKPAVGTDDGAPEQTSSESGATATTVAEAPTFTVDPTSLSLDQLLTKEAKIVVKNTSDKALSVQSPTLRGGDAAQFAAKDESCTDAKIPAGDTCEMTVMFTPKASGRYSATLVVTVKGAPAPVEVALRGSAVL